MVLVQTDSQGGVVLPGHPGERFLLRENEDGSILLEPVHISTRAQAEYDSSLDLRSLLARASQAPSVAKNRAKK